MSIFILLLSLISFKAYTQESTTLKPFLTDYCTGYREGTRREPELWKHCCLEHDLYFWAGGSLEDRKATDLRLRDCVAETGETLQARLIYTAVTIGGRSPIRFKTKQWGHAFEDRARYLKLSEEETLKLLEHLRIQNPELPPELQESFKDQLFSRLEP